MNKRILLLMILPVCFIILANQALAQEITITRSEKTEVINGKTYYIHTVNKGHTLFSIARVYGVTVDDLLRENPETKNGLSVGQLIKVPAVGKNTEVNKAKQTANIETPADSINYIQHTVKPAETLYSIAKIYELTSKDIINANSGLNENIKPGQVIKIPVKKSEIKVLQDTKKPSENYIIHTVQKKETLYSIAKGYLVSVDEIKSVNPGIDDKLKNGQSIKIPIKNKEVIKPVNVIKPDTVSKNEFLTSENYCKSPKLSNSYNVALFIPFYLGNADDVYVPESDDASRNFKSLNFIEFYEGALMAVDTMSKRGMKCKLYVYDDPNDSSYIRKIAAKPEFKKMDLSIGPFYRTSFEILAKHAGKNKMNVVNPVSPREALLDDSPNVFKVVPSNYEQYIQLATYFPALYPNANVIIVNNFNNKDLIEEALFLKTSMNKAFIKSGVKDSVCNLVNYYNKGMAGVAEYLKPDCQNIVITLATGEIFYSSYIRNLRGYLSNYDIILYAQPYIKKYESLEIDYLQDLKLHIFAPSFIDYSRSKVKDFVASFRNNYSVDPDSLAFAGYDITLYFLESLYKYGKEFNHCISSEDYEGLNTYFKFRRDDETSGYENKSISIYKYEDFKLVKVK